MPLLLSDRAQTSSPLTIYTRHEARMLGIALDTSRWLRLRKGLYVESEPYLRLPPWQRYAVRVHAFLRRHPDAVLCLESAALAHGLPGFGEPRWIHVLDPDGVSSQARGDLRVHTSRTPREIVRKDGMLVTSLHDTVIDLVRVMAPADALAIADSALSPVQGGIATLDELRRRGEQRDSPRGAARMRWVWDNADDLSESPNESVSRAVIGWSGFEPPVLQKTFHYEGHEDRCDFFFESCRGIGEADGWGKYRLGDPEQAAQLLAEEKRREDRLRRHRHPFARWEPRDAWKASTLARTLRDAGIPRLFPENAAMLATLRTRPRSVSPRRQA